jgi:hypothetical protein
VGEDDSQLAFGKKFSGEKESVRRCVEMQNPVLLSPTFRAKSSHISRSCRKTLQ